MQTERYPLAGAWMAILLVVLVIVLIWGDPKEERGDDS